MSRRNANSLPWVILRTSGTNEVGTFGGLVNISPPIVAPISVSEDQWFNEALCSEGSEFTRPRGGLLGVPI